MNRTQWLQETRKMRFEEAYSGWSARRLSFFSRLHITCRNPAARCNEIEAQGLFQNMLLPV
ncbi:MAG: hypothetical protein C4530_12530 [Desulfobacteraceae bacterium]|nr:MAG: hypothetical protein C4530_12530 [Desulfobacteraceae bacterium]